MLANQKLAASVQNMGFYKFRRQLEYKTKLYGSFLVVVDRWFPPVRFVLVVDKRKKLCVYIKEYLTVNIAARVSIEI